MLDSEEWSTYLQEEQFVRASEFFEELDASNRVGRGVDGEQVREVRDRRNVADAVLAQVQMLQVFVRLQLAGQILNGRVRLLQSQGGEGVRAAI